MGRVPVEAEVGTAVDRDVGLSAALEVLGDGTGDVRVGREHAGPDGPGGGGALGTAFADDDHERERGALFAGVSW